MVPDALSRTSISTGGQTVRVIADPGALEDGARPLVCYAIVQGVDYEELAQSQVMSPEVKLYQTSISGLHLRDIPFADGKFTLLCDVKTGRARPIVPEEWRERVFHTVHDLSHPGVRTTQRLVATKFVWNGLQKQIGQLIKQCLHCQRSKVHKHTKTPSQKLPTVKKRFQHVQVDLVGSLQESQGFTHLLTIIDSYTRWPMAIPIKETDSMTVAKAYVANWVASFGVPANMTSDRGVQFISHLWRDMLELFGTQLHPTTAYHP